MSDFISKPIQKKLNRGNPISRIEKLESKTGASPSAFVGSLEELSNDLGNINEGAFIDPASESSSENPEDSSFTGVFLTGDGFTPADGAGEFNLGFVDAGVTFYGIGEAGEYANGMDFVGVHKATGTSTAERRLRRGFQELQGNDDPSYIFEFLDTAAGANLITSNPGFETGDATGWTFSSGTSVVASSLAGSPSGWGSYCLKLDNGTNDSATSDKYACSAGSVLLMSFEVTGGADDISVYIRFYNAVPTLLSSSLIKELDAYPTPNTFSGQAVVPVGATQFDVYVLKTVSSPGTPYFDNFDVQVVTISNEFGFHGEDGHLLMGNGKFKTNDLGAYISRGKFRGVVYSKSERTNITQTSTDSTTVFSVTVPANFFSKGYLRFECWAWTNTPTSRTLTTTLTCGASTAVTAISTGAGQLRLNRFYGSISKGGSNIQDMFLVHNIFEDNVVTTWNPEGEYTQAGETESGTISVSLTMGLSNTVTAGWFGGVFVEAIMDVDNIW